MAIELRAIEQDPASPVKPWMRLACLLYSNGTPLADVAREVSMDAITVSNFVTSPRGIAIMKALVSENPDRMANIIEATVVDSLLALVRIRDTAKLDGSRLSAAGQLLDRFYPKSKAADPVKKAGSANDFVDIQSEIAKLRAEVTSID